MLAVMCLFITGFVIGILFPGGGTNNRPSREENRLEAEPENITAQKASAEIEQVIPMSGFVTVLYSDGTVRVSGNDQLSAAVSDWQYVERLYIDQLVDRVDGAYTYEYIIYGLTESGAVMATNGSLSDWSNIKELHFSWQGVIGVTKDGKLLADGKWEDAFIQVLTTEMSNVETVVESSIQRSFAVLKRDGTVCVISENGYIEPCYHWDNVKEVRNSGHAFYVIKEDGTVDGGVEGDQPGLDGAVKIVSYDDWLFGISADGRLLTHNGGSIYPNSGEIMVDVPGLLYYGEEVDIRQYHQIEEIIPCYGLILLNKDGTVDAIGAMSGLDLSGWNDIEMIYTTSDFYSGMTTLYGIKHDGSVITVCYYDSSMTQIETDQYRGWKLKKIYTGIGGVVGLTVDGKLVGDGIYENIDFTVFDK